MIADIFHSKFQRTPETTWQAPGRVNLIGEHTDYNDGFVLPIAIERKTTVGIARNDLQTHRIYSTNTDELIEHPAVFDELQTSSWAKYPLGVIKLMELSGQGLDIAIDSDVPAGSGLSSSAALECSVATAINQLLGLGFEKLELAKICQRAENEVVGAPTGNMDQIASLFGEQDKAVFIDCQTEDIEPLELGFSENGLELMVISTKTSHDHSDGGYGNRRAECYSASSTLGLHSLRQLSASELRGAEELLSELELKRARHVVTENERVLEAVQALKDQDFKAFGKLMNESHVSMRDDFEISTDQLDTAVEVSQGSGAIGSRMTGGGFGGSAIALVQTSDFPQIMDSVLDAFRSKGFLEPDIFKVNASSGAKKLT